MLTQPRIVIDLLPVKINYTPMKKSFLKQLLIVAVVIYMPLQSMAWGRIGHRVVGQIAESYLTANAKKKIKEILGDESLAMASNWADFIKSDSNYRYLSKWHYVNFDAGMTSDQMKAFLASDTAVDAYSKLVFMINELKKPALPHDQKLMYLRLVIHIVGDVHQPLHVSAKGTTGGNDIKLNWLSESSNLHRVWDSDMPDFQQLSFTEIADAINFTTKTQRKEWQRQPISEWLYESYKLSEQIHEGAKAGQRLGYDYDYANVATMYHQMLKGGVRLAGLLNEIFKG
jgi:hypothetical protein